MNQHLKEDVIGDARSQGKPVDDTAHQKDGECGCGSWEQENQERGSKNNLAGQQVRPPLKGDHVRHAGDRDHDGQKL